MDHYVYSGLTEDQRNAIKDVLTTDVSYVIQKAIHKVFGIKPDVLRSPNRKRELCDARQMYFSLLRRTSDLPLKEIGRTVERHHSTVISSIKAHKAKLQYDTAYKEAFAELCTEIHYLIKRKYAKEE